jgi:pimeloyl-ACP methyl ester carboxylesterase
MFSTIKSYRIKRLGIRTPSEKTDFAKILTELFWNRIKKHNRRFLYRICSYLKENPNNLLKRINSLSIPILLIYGTKDSVVPLEIFYLLEKYLPDHTIIERTLFDHGIAHEHSKFFNSRLLDFCGNI